MRRLEFDVEFPLVTGLQQLQIARLQVVIAGQNEDSG